MKTYIKFLINLFNISFIKIFTTFFFIILITNILEQIEFFKDKNLSFLYIFFLSFLNTPSILFDILPFIFLLSTQVFFIYLIDKNELKIFKYSGLDNIKIVKFLGIYSFIIGIIFVVFFYNGSSILKNSYLLIKNNYSDDNKYLAVITENGIWIKDEIDNKKIIINANLIEGNILKEVVITQFDNNFSPKKYIYGEIVDIKRNDWVIKKAIIIENNIRRIENNFLFQSNFNSEKISTLFSNLTSLTIWELFNLREEYISVGYSVKEINLKLQKIYSFPIYITILTIFASVLMLNVPFNKPKFFYLIMGIFASVLIFYINHFSSLLGENNKLPVTLSVWLPHVIVSILTGIGMVRINEK